MGLDIMAFERVTLLKKATIKQSDTDRLRDQYEGRADVTYLYRSFEAQADGMVDGFYARTGASFDFRAGSCTSYGEWRKQLAKLVGTTDEAVFKDPKPGPFVELINFSDCEGVIGPTTSAKLAADFREWADRAQALNDAWFFAHYRDFRKAFEIAATGGAVKFH